jgi:hypothetical protein
VYEGGLLKVETMAACMVDMFSDGLLVLLGVVTLRKCYD